MTIFTETPISDEELFAAGESAEPAEDFSDIEAEMARYNRGRFAIQDEETADWAAWKMVTHAERIAAIKAQSASRLKEAQAEAERFRNRFESELITWFEANRGTKSKSLKLASCTLSMRTVPGGFRVTDQEAAIGWANDNKPEAITTRTVQVLDENALILAAKADGEVIPGLEYRDERESFSVKAPKVANEA